MAEKQAKQRTSRPLAISTLIPTFPMPLRALVHEFELRAYPPEKISQSSDGILELPHNPQKRSASHQRTSGGSAGEELLKCPLGTASLEMVSLATTTAALAESSTRETEITASTTREASSPAAPACPVLEALLAVLIVDAALFGVGEDFVRLGYVFELFGSPLLLLLVFVRVVLEGQLSVAHVCTKGGTRSARGGSSW